MNSIHSNPPGERVTLRQLFERHRFVEIPIIQRDYAQGRPAETEVRVAFVGSLRAALDKTEDDPSLPLDLDFVYGGISGDRFQPLDGQQRLTTLFLLHWYLAWRDGKMADFRAFMVADGLCRFTYQVRASSYEFFNELVNWDGPTAPLATKMSTQIEDQFWYFRSWNLDPTIRSALNMLDELHESFGKVTGHYDRLAGGGIAYITFQLLDLENFGLSDDLYIKMNARGKPLTPFESFKAQLEHHLDALLPGLTFVLNGAATLPRQYFSYRLDKDWADLLWHYRDDASLFDVPFMRLLRVLALSSRDPTSTDFDKASATLGAWSQAHSFRQYQDSGCLDERFLRPLATLLDLWSGAKGLRTHLPDASHYDERVAFAKVLGDPKALASSDLVLFHGYCAYLARFGETTSKEQFGQWMRVIKNLTVNTDYDNVGNLKQSLLWINNELSHAPRILEHLAGAPRFDRGFSVQQLREEQLKAALMIKSASWRDLISEAEVHAYFERQIEFLFKFCGVLDHWSDLSSVGWTEPEDAEYQRNFRRYFQLSQLVFDDEGLRPFRDFVWERALFTFGDFMMAKSGNMSFLTNRDRDASWKRLLRGAARDDAQVDARRALVQSLLDALPLTGDVEAELQAIIAGSAVVDPWHRLAIAHPEIIGYCRNRMVRVGSEPSNAVWLLRKLRDYAPHVELFSYGLFVGDLRSMHEAGNLRPFDEPSYPDVSNRDVPAIHLSASSLQFRGMRLSYTDGQFVAWMDEGDCSVAAALGTFLREAGFDELLGEAGQRLESRDVVAWLDNLSGALVRYGQANTGDTVAAAAPAEH